MKIERKLITPFIANEYLKANSSNRKISEGTLLRYTKEIVEKKWKEDTGELIKISKTGILLDGQHRLHAVVKANMDVYFHVATDLEDEIFDVIDTGKSRSANDIFYLKGIKNSQKLPSIIQAYHLLKNSGKTSREAGMTEKLTNAQLLSSFYERELFWSETVQKTSVFYYNFGKLLSHGSFGGLYAIFYDINTEDALSFMQQLSTGLNLTNNCIGMLRNKLIQDNSNHAKLSQVHKNALVIKTWNFFRKNETPVQFQFHPEKEKFPVPI